MKTPTHREASFQGRVHRLRRSSSLAVGEARPGAAGQQFRIMYIEHKAELAGGEARIGLVTFSKTGKTLYYGGLTFRSAKGGYKYNYIEVDSGEKYWLSGPRKDGADRLYGERVPIRIDENVRESYWIQVREKANCVKSEYYYG